MEQFEFHIPEIRCQTPEDVTRALQHNRIVRERFVALVQKFNTSTRGLRSAIRAEDVISFIENGTPGAVSLEDLRGFQRYVVGNVQMTTGEGSDRREQNLLDEAPDSVTALRAIKDDVPRELNRLVRTVQWMLTEQLGKIHRQIEMQHEPRIQQADKDVKDLPSTEELLRSGDARDIARWVYTLAIEQRRTVLRGLLDASKPTGRSASEVMGPWLGGLGIVLTDSLADHTAEREEALVRYIEYLKKNHPDVSQGPAPEEIRSMLTQEIGKKSYLWLATVSAADLGKYFYECVSRMDRGDMFKGVLQFLEGQTSAQAIARNRLLDPLRTNDAKNEQVFVKAFREVKIILAEKGKAS